MATLLLSVMGAFAEFERALIGERQREGIALAKDRGVYKGRKRSLSGERAADLRARADQGRPGPGVRDQPPDPLPVPALAGAHTGTAVAGRDRVMATFAEVTARSDPAVGDPVAVYRLRIMVAGSAR